MKTLIFLSIIISTNIFSKSQVVECKNGDNYDVTLSFEIPTTPYTPISQAEIEYRGEDLIEDLYPGQTTGDSTGDYSSMKILNKNFGGVDYISFQGNGWNPAYDDPNFYAVVIPVSAIGENLKNGQVDVFLSAYDGSIGDDAEAAYKDAMDQGPTANCWTYVQN